MADLPLGGVTVEIKATIDVLERDLAKARAAVHGFDQEAAQSAKRAESSAQKVGREAAAAAQKATQASVGTAKAVEKVTEASKASGTQAARTADLQVAAARRAADAQIAEQRRVAAHQAAIARGDLVKQVNPTNGVVTFVPRMRAKEPPGVRALSGGADEARTASGSTQASHTGPMAHAAVSGVVAVTSALTGQKKALTEAEKEMAKLGDQAERLRGRLDPVYGALLNHAKAVEDANNLLKRGLITQKEHSAALDLAATKYWKVKDAATGGAAANVAVTRSLIPLALGAAAAAAALMLVSGAMAGSRDATKFASELTETSKRLGVTTDGLQEYRYAAEQSGLATTAADQALAGFGKTLALAQQGSKEAVKSFKDLGFTDAEIKRFRSVEEAMGAVLKRLDGLTGQARVDMVQQLGLEGIAPAIANGTTEMQRLRDSAKAAGVVMDADLVKRGAEIEKQFLAVERVIDIQLKSALISLAPFLLNLIKLTADLATTAAKVADVFRSIENKRSEHLQELYQDYQQRDMPGDSGRRVRTLKTLMGRTFDPDAAPAGVPLVPTPKLPKTSGGGGGRSRTPRVDRSDEQREARRRRVEEEIYRATLAELDIHNGARRSIEDRRDLSLDRLDLEEAHRKVELDQLETDYKISEGKKGISKAERERLETLEAAVRSGERLNIKEEAALDLADERLEFERLLSGFAEDELAIAESMARTQKERRDLQMERLRSERTQARKDLETSLNRNSNLSEKQRSDALNAFDVNTGKLEGRVQHNTMQPLEAFFDGLPRTTDEVNEAFQRMEAEGLSSLIDGLAAASVGAAGLGDVFRNVLMQMAMDANRILLQSLLSGAAGGMSGGGAQKGLGFLASLFGGGGGGGGGLTADLAAAAAAQPFLFADGGLFRGQGGPTDDANLARISNGEFITNAEATRKHLPLLTAINDDKIPGFKKGGFFGGAVGMLMGGGPMHGGLLGMAGLGGGLFGKIAGNNGVETDMGLPGALASVLRGRKKPPAQTADPSIFLPSMTSQLAPDNDDAPGRGSSSRITTSRGTGGAVVQHIVNNYSHAIPDRDARRTSAQSAGAAATKTALAARRGIAS